MKRMEEYFVPKKPLLSEPVLWWILLIFLILTCGVVAIVAADAWRLAKLNKEFLASGRTTLTEEALKSARRRALPLVYEQAEWRVSFEVPAGHAVSERVVSEEGEIEAALLKLVSEDVYADTSVRVWIGKDAGFNRYLVKPYTGHGGYRRITAVGRRAVSFIDPEREAEAIQVIAVDDGRNGREIRVTYSAIQEGAEPLAQSLLKTLRLSARERGEDVLRKDGWRAFVHDPVRFQYPEDYAAERRLDGTITVKGAGGRIEIEPIIDVLEAQAAGRTFLGKLAGDEQLPDDFFDLRYGVTLRVKLFYAGSDEYQRSVLQDISRTITLKE